MFRRRRQKTSPSLRTGLGTGFLGADPPCTSGTCPVWHLGVPPHVSVHVCSAWWCVPQIPPYQHHRKTLELGCWTEQSFFQWSQLVISYQQKEFLTRGETFLFPLLKRLLDNNLFIICFFPCQVNHKLFIPFLHCDPPGM